MGIHTIEKGQERIENVTMPAKGEKKSTDDSVNTNVKSSQQKKEPRKPAKYGHYERTVVDYVRTATAKNVWYYRCVDLIRIEFSRFFLAIVMTMCMYRDRLSTPRGPCSLPVLRECWVNGIIDENTLVWGQGLADWLPVKNVRTLVPQIRTLEVQAATWMKKTFSLKPALNQIRKERAAQRLHTSSQVDNMY